MWRSVKSEELLSFLTHLLQGGGTNGHLEHPFAAMDIRGPMDRHPGGGRFKFKFKFLLTAVRYSLDEGSFSLQFSFPCRDGRDGRENRGGNSDRGYPPVAEVSVLKL